MLGIGLVKDLRPPGGPIGNGGRPIHKVRIIIELYSSKKNYLLVVETPSVGNRLAAVVVLAAS